MGLFHWELDLGGLWGPFNMLNLACVQLSAFTSKEVNKIAKQKRLTDSVTPLEVMGDGLVS